MALHTSPKLQLKRYESGFVYLTDLFLDHLTIEPHVETLEMSVIQWNLQVMINNLY